MLLVDPPPPHLSDADGRDKEAVIALLPYSDSGLLPTDVAAATVSWVLAQMMAGAGVETTLAPLEDTRPNLIVNIEPSMCRHGTSPARWS